MLGAEHPLRHVARIGRATSASAAVDCCDFARILLGRLLLLAADPWTVPQACHHLFGQALYCAACGGAKTKGYSGAGRLSRPIEPAYNFVVA